MKEWMFKNRLYLIFGLIIVLVLISAYSATFGRAEAEAASATTVPEVAAAEPSSVVSQRASLPAALQIQDGEIQLGNPNAPVQIVEYGSLTCGHCATFHNEVFPAVRKELIDTGRVHYAFRYLPWDNLALAVSKIVACGEGEQRDVLLSAFFKTQQQWVQANDQLAAVKQVARLGGFDDAKVEACLQDEAIHQQVLASRDTALNELHVKATPTVFVNAERLQGVHRIAEIKAEVARFE